MTPFSKLEVKRLTYSLGIGVTADERAKPQPVSVSLEIRFLEIPGACVSGKLEETVGYDRLANIIEKTVHFRVYELIETLGYDVFTAVKKSLPENTLLRLSICKEHPPIPALQGGAVFTLSDWEYR